MALNNTEDLIAEMELTPDDLEVYVDQVLRERLLRKLAAMEAGELRQLVRKQREKATLWKVGSAISSANGKPVLEIEFGPVATKS